MIRNMRNVFLFFASLSLASNSCAMSDQSPDKLMDRLFVTLLDRYFSNPKAEKNPKIAITDFSNNGVRTNVTGLGSIFADILQARVSRSEAVTLLEREQLHFIVDELNFQLTSADPQSTSRIGKIIGANYLLLGSLSPLNNDVHVLIKLVEVETGVVVGAAEGSIPLSVFDSAINDFQYVTKRGIFVSAGPEFVSIGKLELKSTLLRMNLGYRPSKQLAFSFLYSQSIGESDRESLATSHPVVGSFPGNYSFSESISSIRAIGITSAYTRRVGTSFYPFVALTPALVEVTANQATAILPGSGFESATSSRYVIPGYSQSNQNGFWLHGEAGFYWFISPRFSFDSSVGYMAGRLKRKIDVSGLRSPQLRDDIGDVEKAYMFSGFSFGVSFSTHF